MAPVGLVTTRGFRDVLEIARHESRASLSPRAARAAGAAGAAAPAPRDHRAGGAGRHRADPARARRDRGARRGPPAEGVEAVAVCLLHAYANPAHEQALRQALAPHFRHVSVSSEINAEFREYERTCTTALNAGVMPLADRYLGDLTAALGEPAGGRALRLLHSAGGMMSVAAAKARPLAMAHVGPRRGRGRGRARGARPRRRSRARLRHGRHDDRRVPDQPTAWPRPRRSGSSATTRCGCPWSRWSPSARAAAPSRAWTRSARSRWARRARALSPGPACYGQGGTSPP